MNANDITTLDDPARVYRKGPAETTTEKLPCANAGKLGKALFKAFDLDAYRVRKISIECQVGEMPTVTITRFVTVEEAERIGKIEPIE